MTQPKMPRDPYEPPEETEEGPSEPRESGVIEMADRNGMVYLAFQNPVQSVALTPEQAKEMGGRLINLSREAQSEQ